MRKNKMQRIRETAGRERSQLYVTNFFNGCKVLGIAKRKEIGWAVLINIYCVYQYLSRPSELLQYRGIVNTTPRAIFFLNLLTGHLVSLFMVRYSEVWGEGGAQLLNSTILPSSVKILGNLFGKQMMRLRAPVIHASWSKSSIVSLSRLPADVLRKNEGGKKRLHAAVVKWCLKIWVIIIWNKKLLICIKCLYIYVQLLYIN